MKQAYTPGLVARAYYAYRSWNLPWRRRFFRGYDLEGNTYWESYNPLTPSRMRRTVKYVNDGGYTDNAVTPGFMGWLRYTRDKAPTEEELLAEVARIQHARVRAQELSDKWEAERDRLIALESQPAAKQLDQPARETSTQAEADRKTPTQLETSTVEEEAGGRLQPPGTKDEKGDWTPEPWQPGTVRARR
ncbi:hypothetical protein PYCC9005_001464 [Savitreella phatthalungensis]